MSLLNGLAAAGQSLATFASAAGLQAMRDQAEEERTKLASMLAEGAASRGRQEQGVIDLTRQEKANEGAMKLQKDRQDFETPKQTQEIAESKSRVGLAEETQRRKNAAGDAINTMLMGNGGSSNTPVDNNIGNVRPNGKSDGFQKVGSFDEGVALAVNNARAYPQAFNGGKPMTLTQIGEKWAPKGDGANDPLQWAKNVASIGGLPVDQPLDLNDPETAAKFARGVHGAEKGAAKVQPLEAYMPGATGKPGTGTPPTQSRSSSALALLPDVEKAAIAQVAQHDPDRAMTMLLGAIDRQKKEDAWVPLSADAAKTALGPAYDPTKAYQINRVGGKIEPIGGSLVNIQNQGESEALKTQIQSANKANVELQENALKARTSLAQVNRLDNLLDQINTGKFTESSQNIMQIAKGIGIDLEAYGIKDTTAPAQAADALSKQLALTLRDPSQGGGMPGALSDSDRQFLAKMIPTLETTPEGRKMMIEYTKKMYQRSIEVAKIANDYSRTPEFRSDPNGLYAKIQEYSDSHPLFENEGKNERSSAEGNASGFGQGGGPKGPSEMPRLAASDKAAYDAMPSGTLFLAPDGLMRRKP